MNGLKSSHFFWNGTSGGNGPGGNGVLDNDITSQKATLSKRESASSRKELAMKIESEV